MPIVSQPTIMPFMEKSKTHHTTSMLFVDIGKLHKHTSMLFMDMDMSSANGALLTPQITRLVF